MRVVCPVTPPALRDGQRTEFGLQNKDRDLTAGEIDSAGAATFEFEVRAEPLDQTGRTRFLGEFVHGAPVDRFLYLGYRPADGSKDAWFRRWKISLKGIPYAEIDALGPEDGLEIQLRRDDSGVVWPRGEGWKRYSAARV